MPKDDSVNNNLESKDVDNSEYNANNTKDQTILSNKNVDIDLQKTDIPKNEELEQSESTPEKDPRDANLDDLMNIVQQELFKDVILNL